MLNFSTSVFLTAIGSLLIEPSTAVLPYLCGVSLAGYEFGISPFASTPNPEPPSERQISHFIDQGANVLRVPISWETIQPTLNQALSSSVEKNFSSYISQITSKGAYAIVDIHNYARYNGKVIGESSEVSAAALVDLWTRLSKLYQNNLKVIFGLMNEPHDLNAATWAKTLQETVNGIRQAGATNVILLPGESYSSLQIFSTVYSELKEIKNPDGSTEGLVFEFHRYLDSDGSGSSRECTSDRVSEIQAAAKILSADKRQAIITETGGGSTQSCQTLLPKFFQAIKDNYELLVTAINSSSPTGYQDQSNWLSIKKFLPGVEK
ncbi:glycoside hydrolase superfamily [Phakopsora pachyrhizi]|nr:glycoside hydrolase superfamily [Phakopsora pachyrhizi]